MKLWDGELRRRGTLAEALALDLNGPGLVAAVGGGGKTSFLFRLAEECRSQGKTVALTTTTHMARQADCPLLVGASWEEIRATLQREQVALIGEEDPETPWKIAGVDGETLDFLRRTADLVLVEADGAKKKPLKAPAEWEPVIPEGCSAVVAVVGCSGIGRPVEEACHRPERVRALLGKAEGSLVTPADVARLACLPQGLRKGVKSPYRVLVNQVDGPEQWAMAQELAAAFRQRGILAAFSRLREPCR